MAKSSNPSTTSLLRQEFEQEALVHLDTLYASAFRFTRNPSDAEDLVQETVLRAFRFYDRFEAGSNMRAWLLRILTNTFINRYRRKVMEKGVLEDEKSYGVSDHCVSHAAMRMLTDPVESAQRRLILAEIQHALDNLSEDYRLIVLLADVEELSYREIAEVMGCPIGTVMSRLFRARKMLQQHLGEQARAMGIIGDDHKHANATDAPVQLNDYRKKVRSA